VYEFIGGCLNNSKQPESRQSLEKQKRKKSLRFSAIIPEPPKVAAQRSGEIDDRNGSQQS